MSSWKDFFYFNKSQRTGIIVLICLILLVLIINISLPLLFPEEKNALQFPQEAIAFKEEASAQDSLPKANPHYTLFAFDPNTTDSVTFRQLGLNAWTTSNVIKYRTKGGKFRKADDFKKIYGLSEEKFEELKPYIIIDIPNQQKR